MTDTEKNVEINLASDLEVASTLLEQLKATFSELKSHNVVASNDIEWNDIEGYFRNLEAMAKKKLEDLEAKEKEFTEKESHNNILLAEREAAVVAKEQEIVDKIQELKDAAVAEIAEARTVYVPEKSDGLTNGNKVSTSVDDENTEISAQEGESPHSVEENVEGVADEDNVNPREELIQLCEEMDSKGILNFVSENLKTASKVCKEISAAFGSAIDPTGLVLSAMEGFSPPDEGEKDDAALDGMRRSCLIFMEALSAFLSKADNAVDLDNTLLTPQTKSQAKCIADKWKPKLDGESTNGMSLEAEGFLRLLTTFRIASDFNEDDLCKYVLAVSDHRQATELCHSLDLAHKIPGLVDKLLYSERQIDAVHFIHAFELSGSIPSVPILKTYLKDIRRNSQGNGSAGLQVDFNARELEAIKAVISCVEEYKLEAEYPLHQLYIRASQLDKSIKVPRKRAGDDSSTSKQPQAPHSHKRQRPDRRFQAPRGRGGRGFGGGRSGRRQGRGPPAYGGHPQRYPPPATPTAYTYPVATQSYANDPYYYGQDQQARTSSYGAVPPSYGSYQPPSYPPHQPYM